MPAGQSLQALVCLLHLISADTTVAGPLGVHTYYTL